MYRQFKIKNAIVIAVFGVVVVTGVSIAVNNRVQAQVPPATPQAGTTLQQRIEQRKAERGIVLDAAEEKRLPSVCATAQTKVRPIQQAATNAADKRIKINDLVDARLWIMIGKLKIAGIDSYDLETKQAELRAKTTASEQTTTEYRQVLDDLTSIDCKADTVGFKALLETARIYHTQLRDQLKSQRDYVNDDVKTSLNDYAVDLQGRSNTGASQDDGATNESE